MNKQSIFRIILDILIVISVINAWWFVALPLAVLGMWKSLYFIEIIIAGIAYDSLFGFVSAMGVWGYVGTMTSIVVFGVIIIFKKIVRK